MAAWMAAAKACVMDPQMVASMELLMAEKMVVMRVLMKVDS